MSYDGQEEEDFSDDGIDYEAEAENEAMAFTDGVDLLGDTTVTHSTYFAQCILGLIIALVPTAFPLVKSLSAMAGKYSSLMLFLIFIAFSILCLIISLPMAVGNSRRLRHPVWKMVSAVSLIAFYAFALFMRIKYGWLPWNAKVPTDYLGLAFLVGLEVVNLGTTIFLLVELCRFSGLFGVVNFKDEIALEADEDGQWGNDDIRGLIAAANVKDDFFDRQNEEFITFPSPVQQLKEHWYPQPFSERNKFRDTEHYRSIAERAVITYPPRFRLAGFIAFACVLIFTVHNLEVCASSLKNPTYLMDMVQYTGFYQQWKNETSKLGAMELELSKAKMDFAQTMIPPMKGDDIIQAATDVARLTAATVALKKSIEAHDIAQVAAENQTRHWAHCALFSTILTFLIVTWFLYASRLAYRKGLLELALSRPHYRFHPKWHNYASDKKFLGMYISCFLLGYLSILLSWYLVAILLTNQLVWYFLRQQWETVLALAVYQLVASVIFPRIHDCLVSKDGYLCKPRINSLLVFVWEIFYAPQMAVSVLMHVVCGLAMLECMLLRPDQFVLRTGWEQCDMMFKVYASMQYEQLNAAIRKHEGSPLQLEEDWE